MITPAHAAISEIRKDFLNLTSLLPASPIMDASPVAGSYLVCVTAANVGAGSLSATLRWTDENGDSRNFPYPVVNGIPSGCNLIRNGADSVPTIETDGSFTGPYDLFAFGLGFWPTRIQSQGGLGEPLNYTVAGVNRGEEFSFPGFPWLLALIANNSCEWQLSAGSAGTITGSGSAIETAYGTGSGTFTTLSSECSYTLIGVQFGTPAAGPGPLTDYEYNLLDWTDATYPKLMTVLATGSTGANILLASNIAEQPNNGIISEQLLISWSNETTVPCAAYVVGSPSGEPGSCVSTAFVAPQSPLLLETRNSPGQEWGTAPRYSAEVDVVQF